MKKESLKLRKNVGGGVGKRVKGEFGGDLWGQAGNDGIYQHFKNKA